MSGIFGPAFRLLSATCGVALLGCAVALAQTAPAAPAAPADPVVAKVNGQPIHLSDLKDAAQSLPENLRGVPPQTLFPMLLDQLIDGRALVAEARKTGLDKDPDVQRQIEAAEDRALQTAMLSKQVGPSITEAALHAKYDKEIAGKPGEEEVHAKHILVDNEDQAKKIIADLKGGADFAALAKQYSKDPSGAQQGGDLGFFKKDEMVPAFADAAFALQPGQISQTPVHTQFGWHVIMLVERKRGEPPTFEQARDELRQQIIKDGVKKVVAEARADASVERFNLDGSPIRATDTAVPPPAPSKQ
ncbi:MAG TPA: peptidylprolyl isomerase [Acetobacteraceae bacterium]|nr:peptidylprolyl isomerase [Acetobacteraceae bacterium]